MAQHSHPRPPRWAHRVTPEGHRYPAGYTKPARDTSPSHSPLGPLDDIDVTGRVARHTVHHGGTNRALGRTGVS
ncbi:hypothetical protein HTV45_23630 [Streptomyces sp. CHD11]|uniref:hypothetical protein n=1 Tax=Streptomyces sp. CHD11 TaxID=2741325 RepID=UPI001BFCB480|nr:hypothetical protein [Streptomyces sp. CHD11]MBT3153824.1 hypothetical protein [Streptomyces sp. CHD11]